MRTFALAETSNMLRRLMSGSICWMYMHRCNHSLLARWLLIHKMRCSGLYITDPRGRHVFNEFNRWMNDWTALNHSHTSHSWKQSAWHQQLQQAHESLIVVTLVATVDWGRPSIVAVTKGVAAGVWPSHLRSSRASSKWATCVSLLSEHSQVCMVDIVASQRLLSWSAALCLLFMQAFCFSVTCSCSNNTSMRLQTKVIIV